MDMQLEPLNYGWGLGDPNFRQLEPDRQMAQACRCDTTSGLNEKLGTDAAIG
jgi:hypothetical protein